jgi:acetyl esterase/lipase
MRRHRLIGMSLLLAAIVVTLANAQTTRPAERGGQAQRERRRPMLPEGVQIIRNLQYGNGNNPRQTLDLYLPADGRSPRPVIVWIHGGGWRAGSKESAGLAAALTRQGFAVASINYRLSGEATFPAQIHDCKAAVRYLRANSAQYKLDPSRIGAWGASAGGHLAALLGTTGDVKELEGDGPNLDQSSAVQAVCDWFGPTDFLQMNRFPSGIDHDSADSPESRLIGGRIQDHPDKAAAANPITYIATATKLPPFLIMHGDRDRAVPHNQSQLLHDALRTARAEVTFHTVKDGGHGQWPDPSLRQQVEQFFLHHLAPPAPRADD